MSTIKVSSRPKTHVCKDVYKAYAEQLLKENPEWWGKYEKRTKNYRVFKEVDGKPLEVISYPRFRRIVETWFYKAQDFIIEGGVLALGNNLGRVAGRRVERNFKNKQPDWVRTKAMWERKGERKGLVYHSSEDWVRIGWNKPGKIRNETYYRFTPAEGNENGTSFKQRFSQANKENDLLKMRYQFFPYITE